MRREDFGADWELPGPRMALWCIEYIDAQGGGTDGHHERFRAWCRLQAQDWGAAEHLQVSGYLRHALQVDQLDGSNLDCIEGMFRRL